MLYLPIYQMYIKSPNIEEIKNVTIKNHIYSSLNKGLVLFMIPDDLAEADKNVKKIYKVGFLYDLLTGFYAGKNKEDKHKIISEKYHLWFTYRQFHNILESYEKDKSKYLFKRSLLISK